MCAKRQLYIEQFAASLTARPIKQVFQRHAKCPKYDAGVPEQELTASPLQIRGLQTKL